MSGLLNPINRPWDIVGRSELTAELGITRNAISGWVALHDDFPCPIALVSTYPVYDRMQVLSWVRENRPDLLPTEREETNDAQRSED